MTNSAAEKAYAAAEIAVRTEQVTPSKASWRNDFRSQLKSSNEKAPLPDGVKPWKNLRSVDQGVDLIDDIPSAPEVAERSGREYVAACGVPDMSEVAPLVDHALHTRSS